MYQTALAKYFCPAILPAAEKVSIVGGPIAMVDI
jgi:hypothetical protein